MEKLNESPASAPVSTDIAGAVALGDPVTSGSLPGTGAAVLNPADTFVRRHLGPGETDVRPHSSHRRYTMGSDSHLPITWALGTPQRGHTTAPAGRRLAIGVTSYH